jgi:hypothetical protein
MGSVIKSYQIGEGEMDGETIEYGRIGWIHLTHQMWADGVMDEFGGILIARQEHPGSDCANFMMFSKHFDMIDDDAEPPQYKFVPSADNYIVKIGGISHVLERISEDD